MWNEGWNVIAGAIVAILHGENDQSSLENVDDEHSNVLDDGNLISCVQIDEKVANKGAEIVE